MNLFLVWVIKFNMAFFICLRFAVVIICTIDLRYNLSGTTNLILQTERTICALTLLMDF